MTAAIETWRPVLGFEGHYEVSDHGRVRGVDRTITRGDGMRVRVKGCIFRTRPSAKGYEQVSLQRNGQPTVHVVHRLVLEAFVGPRPVGMQGCHNDGNPANNRLGNLRWDTPSGNSLDLVRHGTHNQARKTHCPRGHRLEAPNLSPGHLAKGRRACLCCQRAKSFMRKAAGRGEVVDFVQRAHMYYERLMRAA